FRTCCFPPNICSSDPVGQKEGDSSKRLPAPKLAPNSWRRPPSRPSSWPASQRGVNNLSQVAATASDFGWTAATISACVILSIDFTSFLESRSARPLEKHLQYCEMDSVVKPWAACFTQVSIPASTKYERSLPVRPTTWSSDSSVAYL